MSRREVLVDEITEFSACRLFHLWMAFWKFILNSKWFNREKKNSKLISSPVNINYLSFELHLVQIWWNEHCDSDWLDFDWIEMMQHSMDCITAILKSKTTSSKLPTHVTERWLINYSHRFFNIQTDILLNSDFAYVYCAFVMATCTYSLPPNFPLFN